MTDATIGFLLAIACSISFGAYILPRKASRLPVVEYQYWVAATIAPITILLLLATGAPLLIGTTFVALGLLCGVLWTFGSISYSAAVDCLGVARSTPIKNFAPAFAAVYGIAFFGEYGMGDPRSLIMAISGVACMVLAAIIIGKSSANEHETARAFDAKRHDLERRAAFRLGVLFSLGAAFFYGAYSVPLKYLFRNGVDPISACAWLGIGVLGTTIFVHLMQHRALFPAAPKRREFALAASAGGIWVSGQAVGAIAMLYIPMSISWPVSNLGTLVALLWGVFVFREVKLHKHRLEIALSVVVYVIGLALLAFAAPAGKV